jgi:hypothetical protein
MIKKRNKALYFIAVLVILGVGSYLFMAQAPSKPSGRAHAVKYALDGGCASVMYQNQAGSQERRWVISPWTLEMSEPSGFFAYISAQNQSARGSCHVVIYVDGALAQEGSADEQYGTATASLRIP